jgi:hypothetical protein
MRNYFERGKPIRKRLRIGARIFPLTALLLAATLVIQESITRGDILVLMFGCLFLVTLTTFTLVATQAKRLH